jgi:hypothetical protein
MQDGEKLADFMEPEVVHRVVSTLLWPACLSEKYLFLFTWCSSVQVVTAPYDPRFPNRNQARHCFVRYNEYHK